jgi:predicted secreted hydrolase
MGTLFDRFKSLGQAAGLPWMPPVPRPRPLDPVVLPQDERPHDRLVEWWHFMGRITPARLAGDTTPPGDISFIVSVLRGRVVALQQIGSLVVLMDEEAHTREVSADATASASACFDPDDGRSFFFQFGTAPARPGGPMGWTVAGGMGSYSIDVDTHKQLSLTLRQRQPAVLLGRKGVQRYGDDDELGYCVWPHLTINGTMGTGLEERPVEGFGWMEHQWGDVAVGDYRWKFLAVRFEQRKYIFIRWEGRDTQESLGYALGENGVARPLGKVEVADLEPSHRGYPVRSRVRFTDGSKSYDHTIEPLFTDQFLDGAIPGVLFPEFWEGVCRVVGDESAWAITELAGYRRSR